MSTLPLIVSFTSALNCWSDPCLLTVQLELLWLLLLPQCRALPRGVHERFPLVTSLNHRDASMSNATLFSGTPWANANALGEWPSESENKGSKCERVQPCPVCEQLNRRPQREERTKFEAEEKERNMELPTLRLPTLWTSSLPFGSLHHLALTFRPPPSRKKRENPPNTCLILDSSVETCFSEPSREVHRWRKRRDHDV